MTAEEMKEIVRRSVREFWNTGNVGVMPEIYHPDYMGHDPSGMHAGSLAQFTASAKAIFAAFSGLEVIIDDLLVDGDQIVKRWTARCSHTGEYLGMPASGAKIEITGINIYRIVDGKIAETWANSDTLGMLQQMGVIPKMG